MRYMLDTSIDCTEQKETLAAVAEDEQRDWKERSISVDLRSWTPSFCTAVIFLFFFLSSITMESGSTFRVGVLESEQMTMVTGSLESLQDGTNNSGNHGVANDSGSHGSAGGSGRLGPCHCFLAHPLWPRAYSPPP